jgi:hypothetical protein
MGFTIEEKAFLLEYYFRNGVNRQPIKRLRDKCNSAYEQRKTNVSLKEKMR